MFQPLPRQRPKKSQVQREEERAWVGFYRRVRHDPVVASEVQAQLDADPESKRTHLALYLCCKESLRLAKTRQARNKRLGKLVRWCCHRLLVAPARAARWSWHSFGEICAASLPDIPAVADTKDHRPAKAAGFEPATVQASTTGPSTTKVA